MREEWSQAAGLAALYSPLIAGALPARGWGLVHRALGGAVSFPGAAVALQRRGLWDPASRLMLPGVQAAASALVASGEIWSAACAGWPLGWGVGAPPCGAVRFAPGPVGPHALGSLRSVRGWVAVVGSRSPLPEHASAVASVVQWAGAAGFGVISGGARGVDSLAASACAAFGVPLLEVLPHGLGACPSPQWGCQFSAYAPGAGFSSLAAMERNRLIYAACSLAVVFHPRLGVGGSWHGAVAAVRGRLCPVAVWGCPASLAASGAAVRALGSLGAVAISSASALAGLLAPASLFGVDSSLAGAWAAEAAS